MCAELDKSSGPEILFVGLQLSSDWLLVGLLSVGVMVASPGIPRLKHCELVLGYRVPWTLNTELHLTLLSQSLFLPFLLLKTASTGVLNIGTVGWAT